MAQQNISISLAVMAVFALTFGPARINALTCTTALTYLLPCQPFLVENGQLSTSCCQGVHDLIRDAATSFKRHLCLCIKQAATSAKVDPNKVERLTQFCNINLPLPINANVDECMGLPTWNNVLKPSVLDSQI